MKKSKTIKTPSLEAIDNISNLIYNSFQGALELETIKTNVSKVLLKGGSSNFVTLYNIAITDKDYSAFTENLNITKK